MAKTQSFLSVGEMAIELLPISFLLFSPYQPKWISLLTLSVIRES